MKFLMKLKKSISIVTAISLLISFVIGPTAANAMTNEEATAKYKQIFKDFMLPYSYGQITSAHYAGTDRVVINIQDLHCHPKVQKNIANIIETFDKSYGVNKVYLEGAYGQVDTSWINKKIQQYSSPELLDKMLETGRLTGAEYYSALSGKNQIINGLEEKGPYLENLKRFGQIVENQEKINLILKAIDESVALLKKKYYTKRQYKLEELSNNYRTGKISSQKYYALLSKHTDKLGIDLSKYENTFTYIMLLELQKKLDYSKITGELQNLVLFLKESLPNGAYKLLVDNTENFSKIDKLYGYIVRISRQLNLDLTANFPNLDNYFGYVEFSQKINPLELIEEEKRLTEEINTRFSETKAQREVVFLINFGNYLKDYVTSKITSDDYDYYEKNINTYRQLWNKYVDNRVLSLLDDYVAEADKFYKINLDRNIYFTNNMFKESDELNKLEIETEAKGDVNKIIENMKGVKEVDVVITGGFHSQTVTEILKNHGVSYIVITPNVTDGVKLAEETYYEIAKEQSKISFQTLATLIASLSPAVQQQIFESIDVKNKIEEISTLSAEEKKKKLREIISAKLLESDDEGEVIKTVLNKINEYSKDSVSEDFLNEIDADEFKKLLEKDKKAIEDTVLVLNESSKIGQAVGFLKYSLEEYMKMFYKKEQQIANEQQVAKEQQESENITFVESKDGQTTSQTQQQLPSTKLTTVPTQIILKILRIDEESDRGQKTINFLENWQIMLGIFFPVVRKIFVNLHGKQNKGSVEEGLRYIVENSDYYLRDVVQHVPTMNFVDKIIGFTSLMMRRYTKEDISSAHSSWNKLQLLKKQINDNDVSKDLVLDLLNMLNKFDKSDTILIIDTVFDFIDKEKTQTEKIKLLKELSNHVMSFSEEQKNSFVNKFFELSDIFSASDRMEILRNFTKYYEKFNFTDEQKNQFIEELKKITGQKTKESKNLFYTLVNKANYFDDEQRKFIADMAIEEGVDISALLYNFDYFDIDTKNIIFDLSVKTLREEKQKDFDYIFTSLIQNMYKLNSQQKDIVFTEAINFINSDNDYKEKSNILKRMIENINYFNQYQQKEIYDVVSSFVNGRTEKDVKSLIFTLLNSLSAEEFSGLDIDLREKLINTVLKLKLEDFGNTKEVNFNTKETFGLINVLLQKLETFNGEQKNMTFDIVDNVINNSVLEEQDKIDFLQILFEQITLFPEEQQDKIKSMAKEFDLQFSSRVIGNNTYTSLVSKIQNIMNKVVNKYKFFKLKNSSQTKDTEALFQNYTALEDHNLKVLRLLMNLSTRNDLENLYIELLTMNSTFYTISYSELSSKTLTLIEKKFKPWLFENVDIDIEKQKELHGYNIDTIFSADLKDVTINDLINVIHQTAINEFKNKMVNINFKKQSSYVSDLYIQNFSKDGYINPEIKKLLSKIVTLFGAMVCFDENKLVISITPVDRHSTTIIVNTDNINRGISFTFYDALSGRATSVKAILEKMGFEAELKGTFVNASLNKTNGLNEDTDLTEMFDLLLRMFYLTSSYDDKEFLSEDLEEYTEKYMIAVDNGLKSNNIVRFSNAIKQNEIFSTLTNLNSVLRELGLQEIPEDNSVIYEDPFTHEKVLGQKGINKYFNEVLDRAFSEGKIIVDKKGNIIKNKDYTEIENIQTLLSDITATESEVLKQASIIDELNKQNVQVLKLETKAITGQLEYQTGYLQLSTGEYIFVKVLKNSVNGMIRYANVDLVSQDGQRKVLNSEELLNKIVSEGYKIHKILREKSGEEKELFRKELKGIKETSENISLPGRLMGGEKTSVVGRVVFDAEKVIEGQSVLFKEYLEPNDMQGTLNARGIVLTSGMELSHQGLIVKEKGILATIITGVKFTEKDGKKTAEIKYNEYSGTTKNLNGVGVEEVVEKKILVNEGDEIAIDGNTGRVIIFDKDVVDGISKDEKKLKEYRDYKRAMETKSGVKESLAFQTEKTQQTAEEQEIIESYIEEYLKSFGKNSVENYIKGFNETVNKEKFGTKATNLQEMSKMGIEVPFGIMIGDGAFFLSILKQNKNFEREYIVWVEAVRSKNIELAQKQAKKIIEIIEKAKEKMLEEIKEIIERELNDAKKDGYIKTGDRFFVRSTFKNEDGNKFNAAGVGESVNCYENEIAKVLISVLKSAFSERSVAYQCSTGQELIPAAVIQKAVDSKKSAVMLVKGNKITISGSWGLGEIVVSGEKSQSRIEIEIDESVDFEKMDYEEILKYIQNNPNCIKIIDYVIERQDFGYGLKEKIIKISPEDSTREIFSSDDIQKMVRDALYLKKQYGYNPDIELAFDENNVLNILQIRPITEKTEEAEEKDEEKVEEKVDEKSSAIIEQQEQETPQHIEQIQQQQKKETKQIEQTEQTEQSETESVKESIKTSVNPVKAAINLLKRVFDSNKYMTGKNIIIDDEVEISDELKQQATQKGINIITLKILTDKKATRTGGKLIDEENKIRMYFNSNTNELTVYSKKGISLSTDEIKKLISQAYSEGRKDLNLDGEQVIAFAEKSDISNMTIETIENRVEIARKNGIIKADTEIKFDLRQEKISEQSCKGEQDSTGANTFIVMQEQLNALDEQEIKNMREKYRFVVSCEANNIPNTIEFDGLQIDATGITTKEQALAVLKSLKKLCNVEKTISIEFDEKIYELLDGVDIFGEYGILPVINADNDNALKQVKGKKEVKGLSENTNMDKLLTSDDIIGVIADSQSRNIFSVIKDILKIKTSTYEKGLNVGLREGGTCDVSKLKNILTKGKVTSEDLSYLSSILQTGDLNYLDFLLKNDKAEEAMGFVMGIAMSNMKKQWMQKFENIDDKAFMKEGKGQYEKGLLFLMLSMQVSGVDIQALLEEVSVAQYEDNGWEMSAEQMYTIIGEKASAIITRVLNENDKKIKELSGTEIARAKEDFKDLNTLIQDRFRTIEKTKELTISATAIKSILAAA